MCINDENFDSIRMGSRPILPIKGTVAIDTILNFDGDFDVGVTCKQAFTISVNRMNVRYMKRINQDVLSILESERS